MTTAKYTRIVTTTTTDLVFPPCPSWCDGTCGGDAPDVFEYGITHMRFFYGGKDDVDDVVVLEQHDTVDEGGVWWRGRATINLMRHRHLEEFSLRGLSPEQAYAAAALLLDERLAGALLDAVDTAEPQLTAVPA